MERMPAQARGRARDRIAAAFLLCLMAVGSLFLWVGVPAGSLYLSSKLVDSLAMHFVVSLPVTMAAMIAWGYGLFWLNALYLRITGFFDEPEDPDQPPRRIRGPLEPILVSSLVLALIALFVWFFVFAENPSIQVI
ncbi:MAG TPA: hypothetical protein VFY99_02000 [Solirubrobacterales bacterium]